MRKRFALLVGITAIVYVAGCKDEAPMPSIQGLGSVEVKVFKKREDIHALFPTAEWLEAQQGEAEFIFCANTLPSYGNSIIDVQGWVFRSHSDQWDPVLMVRLNGVGKVVLNVDPNTYLLSANGAANNQFLGKPVCTFDLRATE